MCIVLLVLYVSYVFFPEILSYFFFLFFFFFQAEDGIRDGTVTGVQTCALPIFAHRPDRTQRARRRAGRAVRPARDPLRTPRLARLVRGVRAAPRSRERRRRVRIRGHGRGRPRRAGAPRRARRQRRVAPAAGRREAVGRADVVRRGGAPREEPLHGRAHRRVPRNARRRHGAGPGLRAGVERDRGVRRVRGDGRVVRA